MTTPPSSSPTVTAPRAGIGALLAPVRHGLWWMASAVAAVSGLVASAIGLANGEAIYGRETPAFIVQAIAQDLVNLMVAAPATLVLAWLARRGSVRAGLLWLGVLTFTVYNYVIYTMSIHVGPLFLVWVAVLGLTFWSLVGGLRALRPHDVSGELSGAPRRVVGWYLVVIAAVFALLWLSDLLPAIAAGQIPDGAAELNLPSNPVHVLDLAFFLPAVLVIGVRVLRRRADGLALAAPAVVFLVLTGLPILLTPFVSAARGQEPAWAVLGPVGAITFAGVAVLVLLLRSPRRLAA